MSRGENDTVQGKLWGVSIYREEMPKSTWDNQALSPPLIEVMHTSMARTITRTEPKGDIYGHYTKRVHDCPSGSSPFMEETLVTSHFPFPVGSLHRRRNGGHEANTGRWSPVSQTILWICLPSCHLSPKLLWISSRSLRRTCALTGYGWVLLGKNISDSFDQLLYMQTVF